MRIKSKDIAEALRLSTATVSLAINDRPGVNQETREKVLAYIRQKEIEYYGTSPDEKPVSKGTVVMVSYWKHGAVLSRSAKVSGPFSAVADNAGYNMKIYRFHEKKHVEESLFAKIREDQAKGIYLMAAEMEKEDIYPFLKLDIPVVVGDHDFYDYGIDSYLIDNHEGVRNAVQFLLSKGHTEIAYLAERVDIFNFRERREAFLKEMECNGYGNNNNHIIKLGRTMEETYESMKHYLQHDRRMPTACILESSVVSLGVSKALLEAGMSVPEDISLIGFDALPPQSLPGFQLTCIQGTHTKRHAAALRRVLDRIETGDEERIKVRYKPRYVNGNSVKDRNVSRGRAKTDTHNGHSD